MTAQQAFAPRYATGLDAGLHGEHVSLVGAPRFTTQLTAASLVPGRLHLYAGWAPAGSHRVTIVRSILGLEAEVSVSYVDTLRDGRGWAFREATGPDDINGFTLLREAYQQTVSGYDGAISIPVLWDRHGSRIVSDDADGIAVGLAMALEGRPGNTLYPIDFRTDIDELNRWVHRSVERQLGRAVFDDQARAELIAAFGRLDARLSQRTYLTANMLTLADVHLWTQLVRYDAGPNAHGAVGPKLSDWQHLWAYARRLYQRHAFRDNTRFDVIAAPFASLPAW